MFRRLLSLFAALMLLVIGTLPANASAYGRVQVTGSTKATYRAVVAPFATAASATDVLTIYGSSTKTVTVTRVRVVQAIATGGSSYYYLIKRSGTNTGGTSSSATAVPLDSNCAAATASVKNYTANPSSLGTSVGNVGIYSMRIQNEAIVTHDVFTASLIASPVILRGTSEGLAVNFNAVTNPLGNTGYEIEWTEE